MLGSGQPCGAACRANRAFHGFETIAAFRCEFPQTRIIAVSGGGQRAKRDYLEAATLMGVDAALHKPFEIERLLDTLRMLRDGAR